MSKNNILRLCQEEIHHRVNMQLLGNSNRGMKELAIDLLNNSKTDINLIAAGTYLHRSTLIKLRDGITVHPRYDTIERVYKYFNIDLQAKQVTVKSRYANKAKSKSKRK